MAASKYDIVIEQGVTWALTTTLKKKNGLKMPLLGYVGRAQIRKSPTDPTIIAEFTVTIPSEGVVVMSLTDEQTMALNFTYGVYDLILTSPEGATIRILKGTVTFDPDVTRNQGTSGWSGFSGYSGL